MLRELTELILPQTRKPRVCEACGQSFQCGAKLTGCWCFRVKLRATARQELRKLYRACLCPVCLERWSPNAEAE